VIIFASLGSALYYGPQGTIERTAKACDQVALSLRCDAGHFGLINTRL
jgi:hypothetical protein